MSELIEKFEDLQVTSKIEGSSSGSNEKENEDRHNFQETREEKVNFNIAAPPFLPPLKKICESFPTVKIGPTKLAVNERIWKTIANDRVMPVLPRTPPTLPARTLAHRFMPTSLGPVFDNSSSLYGGYINPPPFEDDYSRNLTFTRDFGPVASPEGFVEIRLRENISVLLSLDRSILVKNLKSKVKIAVSGCLNYSSLEHPNGKVFQQLDRVDIIAVNGNLNGNKKHNNFIRYAKMWDKGISLTADGCALIYLVDTAGTRTTSDAVNKDLRNDYSLQIFVNSSRIGSRYYHDADVATKNYHYFTQEDGTDVFDIMGFRVSQTRDGMVRISRGQNRLKIHTSPSNGSATITTPYIHCTASLGQSSHLFVRRDERRMHFDGLSFVVRNAGHSSGFDEQNNLRVY